MVKFHIRALRQFKKAAFVAIDHNGTVTAFEKTPTLGNDKVWYPQSGTLWKEVAKDHPPKDASATLTEIPKEMRWKPTQVKQQLRQ